MDAQETATVFDRRPCLANHEPRLERNRLLRPVERGKGRRRPVQRVQEPDPQAGLTKRKTPGSKSESVGHSAERGRPARFDWVDRKPGNELIISCQVTTRGNNRPFSQNIQLVPTILVARCRVTESAAAADSRQWSYATARGRENPHLTLRARLASCWSWDQGQLLPGPALLAQRRRKTCAPAAPSRPPLTRRSSSYTSA